MTEHLKQKLNDSAVLRWSVLALVAFTMLCGYFLTDVMSPLKPMLEKELLWDSLDYGFFTSAYGWFNVFLLMLIFGGIILDKMGVRFTGMGACLLMVFGCGLKYYAISTTFSGRVPCSSDSKHKVTLAHWDMLSWCRCGDCWYHCFQDYSEMVQGQGNGIGYGT